MLLAAHLVSLIIEFLEKPQVAKLGASRIFSCYLQTCWDTTVQEGVENGNCAADLSCV